MDVKKYNERIERKKERYKELAEKNTNLSTSEFNRSNEMLKCILFGQPILIRHHSENMHRKLIERSHNAMNKSIDAEKKAEYYKNKLKGMENNIISQDDPEAIKKLKEKLENLETTRIKYKEKNKILKKEKKETIASYIFSNLSQNIRSIKLRIERLEKLNRLKESEETINGIVLKVDKELNRFCMFFEEKPSEEVRKKLKSRGFRWSPINECWQSYINKWNMHNGKKIAEREI